MQRTRLYIKTKDIQQYMVNEKVKIENAYKSATKAGNSREYTETKDYPGGLKIEARSAEEALRAYESISENGSTIGRNSNVEASSSKLCI